MTPPEDPSETGLPGLRSWRGVYAAAVLVLVAWISALAILSLRFR